MGANLLRLEKVSCIDSRGNVEVPFTKGIIFKAVDWLIGQNLFNRKIVQQGYKCETFHEVR